MLSDFSKLLSSEVLELVPESGERRFLVHRDLLASQSGYLGLLVGSAPATPRQIDIGLWDTETLAQLVEYIYTNDYQSPDPVSVLATPVVTPEGGSISGHHIRVRRSMLEAMLEQNKEFEDPQGQIRPLTPLSECLSASDLDPPRKLPAAERPNKKRFDPAEHDFEDVFLAHAKIYALALKLGIKALRSLALRRLLKTLTGIGPVKPDMPVIENFVDLARYTYSQTSSPEDPLRRIVSQFAALNFTVLQTKQMRELMSEGGDFPGDLMGKASKRLTASEEGETRYNATLKEVTEVWTEKQDSLQREVDRLRNLVKALRASSRKVKPGVKACRKMKDDWMLRGQEPDGWDVDEQDLDRQDLDQQDLDEQGSDDQSSDDQSSDGW